MFDGLRVIWISIHSISVTIHLLYRSLVLSPRATTNLAKIVELDRVTSPLYRFEVCGRPSGSYLTLQVVVILVIMRLVRSQVMSLFQIPSEFPIPHHPSYIILDPN